MNSPCPGMDPFIEGCGLWEDFHSHLIERISEGLADALPDRYLVRTGKRAYVIFEEEHRERFIEIYEAGPKQRLVTSIEVLSPSNKRPGTPGWDVYQRKRQSVVLSHVNLVEIDLVRGGERMPMLDPWPSSPYTLLVTRPNRDLVCNVWPAHFRRPLPSLPVPLAKPDPDVPVTLQPMIESIYQSFHYEHSIDYRKRLTPPLSAENRAWLKRQFRSGKR